MLYGEIIAVGSQIHTKHKNTRCGQNVELLSVKPGGTYSDHLTLKYFYHRTFTVRCCTPVPLYPLATAHPPQHYTGTALLYKTADYINGRWELSV